MVLFLETIGKVCATHRFIIAFLLLHLSALLLAHHKSHFSSFKDYALASGSLPVGVLIWTLVGSGLGSSGLFMVNDIFYFGFVQLWLYLAWVISFFIVGRWLAPNLLAFRECITWGDVMERMYGRLGRWMAGGLFGGFAVYVLVLQMVVIGYMSHYFLHIPAVYGLVFFSAFVIFYCVWGGMRGIAYTHVLQMALALAACVYVAKGVFEKVGKVSLLHDFSESWVMFFKDPLFRVKVKEAFVWGFFPSLLLTPPMLLRTLIAKDVQSGRRMWYGGAFLYGLSVCLLALIGLGARVAPGDVGLAPGVGNIFFKIIETIFETNSFVVDIVFVGMLGALFATMASYLHAISILLVQDVIEPFYEPFFGMKMEDKRKSIYARVVVLLVGILALGMVMWVGELFFQPKVHKLALMMLAVGGIPLLMGVIGLKTDRISLMVFLITYILAMQVLQGWIWQNDVFFCDCFMLSGFLGVVTYLLAHVFQNKGFVLLRHHPQGISESLLLPSLQATKKIARRIRFIPSSLLSYEESETMLPMPTITFTIALLGSYVFYQLMPNGLMGNAYLVGGHHVIGGLLCVGLMLERWWGDHLKPYFPLYWHCTLFYCLPLGATLTFLSSSQQWINLPYWIGSVVLLAFLVDSATFLMMTSLGCVSALLIAHSALHTVSKETWSHEGTKGIVILLFIFIGVFFFERKKEKFIKMKSQANRIASSSFAATPRQANQFLKEATKIHDKGTFIGHKMYNEEGEEGYWIPKKKARFLHTFSEKVATKAMEGQKDLKRFINVMEKQILGTFDKEETSLREVAEEQMYRLKDQLNHKVQVKLSCKKDFTAMLPNPLFRKVFYELLWNASAKGEATEIEITIDGAQRLLSVYDNGRGIPSCILPTIFDLNYTPSTHSKSKPKISLSFVKMVVTTVGGKISCRSRQGDDNSFTRFEIKL
ncbi:MAG: ATP-binding protein [Bacteroidota bacterium]